MQVSIYTQKWNLCCIDNSLNLAQLKFTTSFFLTKKNNNISHISINKLIYFYTILFLENFFASAWLQTSVDISSPGAEHPVTSHIWLTLMLSPLSLIKDFAKFKQLCGKKEMSGHIFVSGWVL